MYSLLLLPIQLLFLVLFISSKFVSGIIIFQFDHFSISCSIGVQATNCLNFHLFKMSLFCFYVWRIYLLNRELWAECFFLTFWSQSRSYLLRENLPNHPILSSLTHTNLLQITLDFSFTLISPSEIISFIDMFIEFLATGI